MSDRRSSHQHRQTFEEKYRALENELKRKNQAIESLRNDFLDTSQHQNDLSRSAMEQSVSCSCSRSLSNRIVVVRSQWFATFEY